ncbi:hypothetical protein CK203_065487 [Vitis vinifera]|uniref:Uncharacterized protein n=1 Tax=Vitis vinifera TaxID=29760 RepID=A0A438G6B9_VITVI|nr:hypothetical protein CK203_065487 [Vitis vinifera]
MELELKPYRSGYLYDSRVFVIHPDFRLPPQDHESVESGVTFLEESRRSIDQSRFIPSSDSSVEMSDELASTLASIQEFMAGVSRRLDQIESSLQDPHPAGMVTDETIPHASQTTQTRPPGVSLGTPFHLVNHYETIPPPTVTVPPPMVPTIEDTRLAEQEAKVERLESMMRQIRLQDGGLTWDDRDGIPAASLPAKFRMPDIEHYSGLVVPRST